MASDRIIKLRRFYKILVSCTIVLSGILLMLACVGIYLSGDEPFSREAVAAAFSPIAGAIYLCLALVALEFVLNILLPVPAAKTAVPKQPGVTYRRLLSRADTDGCNAALRDQIFAERARRKKYNGILTLLVAASALVFLVYALDGSHFHPSDINSSMVRAMWVLLPCLSISFAACITGFSLRGKSLQREIELLKQCPKRETPLPEAPKANHTAKVRLALLLAAAALAIFGFCTGGTADVLTKAVNICTECIGLG